MRRSGEIIIIEDDEDDRLLLNDIFDILDYPNKIVFFEDPTQVETYLSDPDVSPFMILSDINMPKMDGYELRNKILANKDLCEKCVPYIFLSTSKDPQNIAKAYSCQVHGYFKKGDDFESLKKMIQNIVEYWRTSLTPKSVV
ncbi:response regulator [Flavobacterium sp. LHD-80]|uniref:response regulator n=1 Tax=unclassified Flavobacterium TaxID=196869 RepID=UPI0027DECC2E|nr:MULTISPECIES: response regulator [unclassified Flavobacterium]MDQ6470590.1 response regulator [Flavobacterium sp. LHD-80]MDQ6532169.1 response regulator [Flavobacterium sp. LHD-85]